MPRSHHVTPLAIKAAAAAMVAVAADLLLFDSAVGAPFGVLLLLSTATVAALNPAARTGVSAMALGIAGLFALVMAYDPGFLAWCLYWAALASAVLLPRHRFDDAARWTLRLIAQALIAVPAPIADARRSLHRGGVPVRATVLIVPLLGGAMFLLLFGLANPVIGAMLDRIQLPAIDRLVGHGVLLGIVFIIAWAALRPRSLRHAPFAGARAPRIALSAATLALSLTVFNLVFALQNGLDLAFLWSGAALPTGVTLADYAHRGAYTLIFVALLAAAFVLVLLRPGGAPILRPLVLVWLAQTVLLIASSMLRLADYVAAYMLTGWRIAAFAWMLLVATGVLLIGWRWVRARSATWLVNANALAALIVLTLATIVDTGALAASWNVRHARRADQIDLCYLEALGPAALPALGLLERRAAGPVLRDRARVLRLLARDALQRRQGDWRSWTIRGALRLAASDPPTAADRAWLRRQPRGCDGRRLAG